MRIEKDRFGKVKLEDSTLYGIQTLRALETMSFSGKILSDYPELIQALAQVKKAASQANADAGVVDKKLSDAISKACDEVLDGNHLEQFPVDVLHGGGGIGFNTNFNEVISNVANKILGQLVGIYDPVHPKEHVNASQSTADVTHTAFRLAILHLYEHLEESLDYCVDEFKTLQESLNPVKTVSRTCMQDALPVSIGSLFEGYNQLIWRRRNELSEAVADLHKVNLGGTVIGTGDGASKKYRNKVLGYLSVLTDRNLVHRDSLFDAAQNSDDLVAIAQKLQLLASSLIKISKDLRLLSSGPDNGFKELVLPATQEGSSFFEGKVKPVIPEAMINCCFQVKGFCTAAESALNHAELNLNPFESVAAINIMDSIIILTPAIESFSANCLRDITANKQTCQKNLKAVISGSSLSTTGKRR